MHLNPITPSRMGWIARSIFRHPVKRHEFPARNERLITAAELIRYGI